MNQGKDFKSRSRRGKGKKVLFKQFKHESRQRILSKSKKRKREEGKSPFLKGY